MFITEIIYNLDLEILDHEKTEVDISDNSGLFQELAGILEESTELAEDIVEKIPLKTLSAVLLYSEQWLNVEKRQLIVHYKTVDDIVGRQDKLDIKLANWTKTYWTKEFQKISKRAFYLSDETYYVKLSLEEKAPSISLSLSR